MKTKKNLFAITCLLDLMFVFVFIALLTTNENKLQAEEISEKQSQVTQLSSQLETSEALRADTNVKLNNINSKLINTENKLNTVSNKLNDAENQLTAQSSSISQLQKDKDKLKQDIEALEKNNSESIINNKILDGEYSGMYACTQGETVMNLDLWTMPDGHIAALYQFKFGNVDGLYLLRGKRSKSNQLTLNPVRWLKRPTGWEMLSLSGILVNGVFSGKAIPCPDQANYFYATKTHELESDYRKEVIELSDAIFKRDLVANH